MATVILESSDLKSFKVPLSVASYSTLIKTMIDDLGVDEPGSDTEVIPILKVDGTILEKVLEWAKHEQEEPTGRPVETNGNHSEDNDDREMTEWEKKYLEVDIETLYAITRAANYLDVKGLLDLTCFAIANKVKGKNAIQIRELLPSPPVEKENKQQTPESSSE